MSLSVPISRRRPSPRLINAAGAGAVLLAATLLTIELRHADFGTVLRGVNLTHVAIAIGFIALSLIAAAYNLLGFTSLRLKLGPTVGAQLAVSGIRMVAPSAVSTPAIAARYLTRSGVSMPDALATVAVAQSAQLLVTATAVAGLGVYSGRSGAFASISLGTVSVVLLAAVAVIGLAWAVGRSHAGIRSGMGSLTGSVGRLARHARKSPGMVSLGVGASAALTATHVLAFAFCVSAVGGHASYLALTLVYLAAASAGSIIPTPGGVGAVETALITGLTAAGIALPVAAAAALLSRAVAVWLLAIPGWVALVTMRRRGLL